MKMFIKLKVQLKRVECLDNCIKVDYLKVGLIPVGHKEEEKMQTNLFPLIMYPSLQKGLCIAL